MHLPSKFAKYIFTENFYRVTPVGHPYPFWRAIRRIRQEQEINQEEGC